MVLRSVLPTHGDGVVGTKRGYDDCCVWKGRLPAKGPSSTEWRGSWVEAPCSCVLHIIAFSTTHMLLHQRQLDKRRDVLVPLGVAAFSCVPNGVPLLAAKAHVHSWY